ncbi:MAG: phosphoribosyltransferase family protein, partial [SAR324 cluster bacterium]|nr:phosphoribosyltransferase family protein [SAR324 cluster bacterium]
MRRTRATLPQTELPLAERKTNLEDAFSALADVRDKNILLLDDVMTSGSNPNTAARCCKEEGAGKVGALVLCRKMWGS